MINENKYYDEFIKKRLEPDETYAHYFTLYVFHKPPFFKLLGRFIIKNFRAFIHSHLLVCFTNKRIMVFLIKEYTGTISEAMHEIKLTDVKNISVERYKSRTVIRVTLLDDSTTVFNPANSCFGLPNHKTGLLEIQKLYK